MILRDAATEAAVSNEKYNFLRAEQLQMRGNREMKFRGDQPLLPELPPFVPAPPPIDLAPTDPIERRDD
jgi:general secretion pathway protein D